MELDVLDDEIVLVVVGDKKESARSCNLEGINIEQKVLDETNGTFCSPDSLNAIIIKEKVVDENVEDESIEYLEDEEKLYCKLVPDNADLYIVGEKDEDFVAEEEPPDEHIPKKNTDSRKRKCRKLKPHQKSFVKELREQYKELQDNEKLLVHSLAEIMKSVKPPPLPRDHFVMNDILFQCIKCHTVSETIPAAGRHYQERHGARYLTCFACGLDFTCPTYLYKHEKRCLAPDAEVVLKARAIAVGNKGRSRPYLHLRALKPEAPQAHRSKHACELCPATFNNKPSLKTHMHSHNGERPYKCSACPSAYTSRAGLARHRLTHSDIKFVCDHCNRSFKARTTLVTHLDTHLPYRKHVCEECGRRFAQKCALLLHINGTHRNLPPPCACELCPRRFQKMYLLKAHMKKEHGMVLMTRRMFFKKLPMMTDTQIQQAKVVLKSDEPIFVNEKEIDPNEEFLSYIERYSTIPKTDSENDSVKAKFRK